MISFISWTGNSGNTYSLYKSAMTWVDANAFAISIGGYLAKVETGQENAEIYQKLSSVWTTADYATSYAPDGGQSSYVWLGGSDAGVEGVWRWSRDGSQISLSRPEWGSGGGVTEPDNFQGIQDHLAMAMEVWPKATLNTGFVIGTPGEWNDVSGNNQLYFLVEKDAALPDLVTPTIQTFTPSDGATGVAVGSDITFTFDEAIQRGAGSITIRQGSATGTVVETFDAATSTRVSVSGSKLTIDPTTNLAYGTQYFVVLPSGAVKDLANNSYAGSTNTYHFGTIASPTNLPPAGYILGVSVLPGNIAGTTDSYGIEGSSWDVRVETVGMSPGTLIPYSIGGEVTRDDLQGVLVSGYIEIDVNGIGLLALRLNEDNSIEGSETLIFDVGEHRKTFTIFDVGNFALVDKETNSVVNAVVWSPGSSPGFSQYWSSTGKFPIRIDGSSVGIGDVFDPITHRFFAPGSSAIKTPPISIFESATYTENSFDVTFSLETFGISDGARFDYSLQLFDLLEADVSGDPLHGFVILDDAGRASINFEILPPMEASKDPRLLFTFAGQQKEVFLRSLLGGDVKPPTATFFPVNGSNGVPNDSNIVLNFDEVIQRGAGSIVIRKGSVTGTIVESFDAATSNRLAVSGSTLTIDPTNDLAHGSVYFVVLPQGAVKDLKNNSYAGTNSYSFNTAGSLDTLAPRFSKVSPADAATGVAVGSDIILIFNEAIQRGTGNITLREGEATGLVAETFDVVTSTRLKIDGATLTIDPTTNLAYGTQYFVVLPSGAVKDLANNSYAGTTTYDFTTGALPPTQTTRLIGEVYHWKTRALLGGVEVEATPASGSGGSSAPKLFELRNADVSGSTFKGELWINLSATSIENFDLSLGLSASSALSFAVAPGVSGWTVVDDASLVDGVRVLSLSGFANSASSALTGAVKLGEVTSTIVAGQKNVEVGFLSGLAGAQNLTPYAVTYGAYQDTTGVEGVYELTGLSSGLFSIEALKALGSGETGSVINSADALAALKIAVGRNPNSDNSVVSPYQFLSADVNGSGSVNSADALAILKMAVKRSDAPAREWIFVDEKHDFWNEATNTFTTTRTSVPMPSDLAITVDPAIRGEVNLVGMLKGDVNGSWSAPAGSETLPLSYFQALAAANSSVMNIAQFG